MMGEAPNSSSHLNVWRLRMGEGRRGGGWVKKGWKGGLDAVGKYYFYVCQKMWAVAQCTSEQLYLDELKDGFWIVFLLIWLLDISFWS